MNLFDGVISITGAPFLIFSVCAIAVVGYLLGRNAAERARATEKGAMTLAHIEKFEAEIAAAGIVTDAHSPKLLPDYTNNYEGNGSLKSTI